MAASAIFPKSLYLTTVTIGDVKFDAVSVNFDVSTHHDGIGMPLMGSQAYRIKVICDMHDNANMTFEKVHALFDLSQLVTRDKIKDIKIEYWADESHNDALSVFNFRGWISSFNVASGVNHTLTLTLQPALDSKQFVDLRHGN